jgi:hypothetical protein
MTTRTASQQLIRNFLTGGKYTNDIGLLATMGLLPGISTLDKFGENPDVDTATVPEDIWEGGGEYDYDADGTEPIVSIASDDAGDTDKPIIITGLDAEGNQITQTINTNAVNGTTRVALNIALWRVFRLENDEDSTDPNSGGLAGNLFCYTGTGSVPSIGDPEVRAIIQNGNNQTLMALYTVPKGKVGFLFRGEAGISRVNPTAAVAVNGAYFSRRYGKVFKIKKRIDLVSNGSSMYADTRSFKDPIPALTDVKLTILSVSANDVGVYGTFDILLVDEKILDETYLSAIGQPGY